MNKLFIISLTILLQCSCKNSCCVTDTAFENTFSSQLENVKLSNRKNHGGLSPYAVRSIFYLEEITGYKSRVVVSDLTRYDSQNDYRADRRAWKKWYRRNKCLMTNEVSDSILIQVKKSTSWMDDKN